MSEVMAVTSRLIGRFGNQLFQYCHARAYAEKVGAELRTPKWCGEDIFEIEPTPRPDGSELVLEGYCQDQDSLIYSRKQARQWLQICEAVKEQYCPAEGPLAHLRRGDYQDCGYVIVSSESYLNAANKFGCPTYEFVSEDAGRSFVEDFYRLMTAPILFRANSSFSWWAATLGEGTVYSPVIDGLEGGKYQQCEFVEGNWPRLANLPGITDMHLFKESDRYDYDLKEGDLVIDAGAHKGEFSKTISNRYGCIVWAFEPMREYFEELYNLFPITAGNVELFFAGIGGFTRGEEFKKQGDSSGAYATGESEMVLIKAIGDVVGTRQVALLKLNIEGMEFEVLETILAYGIAKQFTNIQVQFHHCVPDAEKRYRAIREELLKTHRPTFDEPWVWQNFEIKPWR